MLHLLKKEIDIKDENSCVVKMSIIEALEKKLIYVVCVGDLFHSELRCYGRWKKALENFRNGDILSLEMKSEMLENINLLQMILLLKEKSTENFHFLKGNHENILNEEGKGNHPFYKMAMEGEMVYQFLSTVYDDALIYVPETGELLLGKNRYETLMATKDDAATVADESEIRITYQKEHWTKGDLRPEHYFRCEADGIVYNEGYTEAEKQTQKIEYDVGFNQTIQVNSTADQCFQHGIGRTVDDLVSSMQGVLDLEAVKSNLTKLLKEADAADAVTLQTQLDAAEKALTLAKDKCQKLFESGITTFQKYLDDTNLSITECGTRSSKLTLIKNRMQNQKTTFETLKSENEDVDITEIAIQLSSAELTYEAALMATGKVMQTTLLNFI